MKTNGFQWNNDYEEAFQGLKDYLSNPPLLVSLQPGEELYLYLAVSDTARRSVLVRQQHDRQQPVYYVSKTLADAEIRYLHAEKIALSLVYTARK
ncbi:hypothetical protein Nepgr_015302 [Nepenthes gracilis]|uniref:Reverse transcriptase/retrotransposon-derived protein RNase H-like domain-containing protein n=1 Tax=Nepenthes gracilis TaxID=150966 RepID=A0AAD3SN85_NEPGR|nr:hypothetical protein Nepgr_015302 [Nepenthes gracilis]